jgi:carnitine O-acetyltransferase
MAPGIASATLQAPSSNGATHNKMGEKDNATANELKTKHDKDEGRGGGVTFARQQDLPKLPVPGLEESCQRYLSSLSCLQTPEAHAKTQKVVERFLQNEGPVLQKELEKYAEDKSSYIEQWWDESYLSASDSVVLNLNPFFILEDDPTPSRGNQLMRTASLILASLTFIHDLRQGVLPPDEVRGTPLDMFQYTRLFGTSRIPTEDGCQMSSTPNSRHIVVMRRGQIYWFDAIDEKDQSLLTERALLTNLQAILKDADQTESLHVAEYAMGVLSTENRKTWSQCRDILKSHSHNARCLEVIDTALFVVCMDDTEPEDAAQLCNNMLCGTYQLQDGVQVGTCTNRWYDKLQIIVCANGAAGINFEHTGVDGHTVLRYVADVYTELIMRFAKSINSATKSLFKAQTSPYARGGAGKKNEKTVDEQQAQAIIRATSPKKLEWALDDRLTDAIRFAETRLSDLICQNECQVMEFNEYGKNFITRHKFSPDAFVQMAFQAAYFTLYGRCETTYEPAMTKAFLHGRTEAIRTVQPASYDFVKTFTSKKAKTAEKIEKLRKACEAHTKLSRACAGGKGFDRHLYGLKCLTQELLDGGKLKGTLEQMPELFRDAGYSTINHTVLSTSNCGNPALRLFGFGPVAPDGFGLGYIIKDDAISVCAASKHLQTGRFLSTLVAYLKTMQEMIVENYRAANERTSQTFIDHNGRECDIRTGLPIGSHQHKSNGYDLGEDEVAGVSGYSFYDEGNAQNKTKDRSDSTTSRLAGVGRLLLISDHL